MNFIKNIKFHRMMEQRGVHTFSFNCMWEINQVQDKETFWNLLYTPVIPAPNKETEKDQEFVKHNYSDRDKSVGENQNLQERRKESYSDGNLKDRADETKSKESKQATVKIAVVSNSR